MESVPHVFYEIAGRFHQNLLFVFSEILVDPKDIILSSFHIKFGLMKNFGKALNKQNDIFWYLQKIFPRNTKAKLK